MANILNRRPGILDFYVQEKLGDSLMAEGKYVEAINAYLTAETSPGSGGKSNLD